MQSSTQGNTNGAGRAQMLPDAWKKFAVPAVVKADATAIPTPHGNIEAKYMEVTPADAERFLANMANNRKPSRHVVGKYAKAMTEGRWRFNGEAIIFDNYGMLVNGQHRCQAAIASGATFPCLVLTGVPRDAFDTMDQGWKRLSGQVLGIDGTRNANIVASAIGVIISYEAGSGLNHGGWRGPSPDECRAFVAKHPGIQDSSDIAERVRKAIAGPPSLYCAGHHLFQKSDPEKCKTFFELLETGLTPGVHHPVYRLRSAIVKNGQTKQGLRKPLIEIGAMMVNAWNAVKAGRSEVGLLRGTQGNAFPVIR